MADTALDPVVPPSMMFGRGNELVEPPPQELQQPPPQEIPPAQGDQPAPPTRALNTGTPPSPSFDEEQEELIRSQQEQEAYRRQTLDINGKPLVVPGLAKMDDFQRQQIQEMRNLANSLPDRRRSDYWNKQANDMEGKIRSDLARQNAQAHREYIDREKAARRQADYPNRTVQQRESDAALLDAAYDTVYGSTIKGDLASDDPMTKLNGDYHRTISPYSTMSKPKPGEDPTVAEARNKQAFVALAQNAAVMNPKLSSESVINYLMAIGSPVDTRQDPAARGHNQLRGKAGTNYKVAPGHDAGDNWILQMPDGGNIRIDDKTKTILDRARTIGHAQGKAWIQKQAELKAKSDKPGWLEQGYQSIFGPRVPAPAVP